MDFFKDHAVALQTIGIAMQAVFTIVLAVVGAVQLVVYFRMRSIMAKQTAISERQVKVAQEQAELAEKQFLLAGRQTDITERQHGLTRLHYITDKRPRLTIRHVVINHPTPSIKSRAPLFQAEHSIKGSLVVVNSGGTSAKFVDSRCRLFWSNVGLPMEPPLDAENVHSLHAPADVRIEGGESCTFPLPDQGRIGAVAEDISFGRGNWHIYVMGYIRYADITDKERFMWFCREYRLPDVGGGEGRFVPVENIDYEAQD